jgi:hypothetical protein
MLRNSWAAGEMWLAMVRAPSTMGVVGTGCACRATSVRSKFVKVANGWMGAGAPGADCPSHGLGRHPGGAKRPAFSGCFGLAVRGRGPSVGHGYKNVKGQGTVTTPCRPPLLRLSGLVGDR